MESKGKKNSAGLTIAWVLLLLGGLAHMLPIQMAPITGIVVWGISLQTVIGTLSVIAALYFLLGDE